MSTLKNKAILYADDGSIIGIYDEACEWIKGKYSVRINDKWGIVDDTGKTVISIKYEKPIYSKVGLIVVVYGHRKGIIDENENYIIPPVCYSIIIEYGFIIVEYAEKFGLFNYSGKKIADEIYDGIIILNSEYATARIGGKWSLIEPDGKVVTQRGYERISGFYCGLATVVLDGKYGYIDKSGKEVIPPQYKYGEDFRNNLAMVLGPDGWIQINTLGEKEQDN